MTRKLWMMAAIAAIALTPLIGIGTAEAHGGGFGGGGFHGGGFHSGGFHDRGFHDRRAFRGFRLGYGGFLGGYLPRLLWVLNLLPHRIWNHRLLLTATRVPDANPASCGR